MRAPRGVALIGFGVDSGIEVVAAGGLLWRFRTAGAGATDEERGEAEHKALYQNRMVERVVCASNAAKDRVVPPRYPSKVADAGNAR